MLQKRVSAILAAAVLTMPLATGIGSPAYAQSAMPEPVRVRGAIVSFGDQALRVNTREGQTVDIALSQG
ncbi:hypothetical protein [uncultured Enterovirga sp.]|uniref:hypothetical protein n=1 Tax=uncultured Enterovirga sp. TaxID=2026352 RepID=UPI0035CC2E48